jgi:DNA-directed RNA polymerase specialized sigma24 family protein
MGRKRKIRYEDKIDIINQELTKRKGRWFLDSVPWIDFDDVEQIIRIHLYQKWNQWDQKRELKPWINKIITNQFKNILRNYYLNFAKPCIGCPFNVAASEDEACTFTKSGSQDNECPLFRKWVKTKKYAHDVKIPVRIDAAPFEYISSDGQNFDLAGAMRRLEEELKKVLPKKQYQIYDMLFIQNRSEDEVAIFLGYKSNEKGRTAGYKQIKNIKKKLKEEVLKLIKNKDILI